jgi:hypothetical protein
MRRDTKLAKALANFAKNGDCCGAVLRCSTCPRTFAQ